MVYLHGIEIAVPEGVFTQSSFAAVQLGLLDDKKLRRSAESLFEDCGIERRHSVVVEPAGEFTSPFYGIIGNKPTRNPSTRARNDIFARAAPALGMQACRRAIEHSRFSPSEVTHLITVTCTGFFNPGLDLEMVQRLGLPPAVQRYQLGFMGCNAAFPALRAARQFCLADPRAVVLVLCVELCSLHLHTDQDMDTLLANSLFSDGAAAAIVSSLPPAHTRAKLETFSSAIIPDSRDQMAWCVGDKGFDIVLSRYVPRIIGANIAALVGGLLSDEGLGLAGISEWAVHPGGKSIVDRIKQSLDLETAQIEASYAVLREYGNMSSATILFVLKRMLERSSEPRDIFAMAFGPGLTVETARMRIQRETV